MCYCHGNSVGKALLNVTLRDQNSKLLMLTDDGLSRGGSVFYCHKINITQHHTLEVESLFSIWFYLRHVNVVNEDL